MKYVIKLSINKYRNIARYVAFVATCCFLLLIWSFTVYAIDSTVSLDTVIDPSWSSLQLDSNGNPVIGYYDYNGYDLKVILCGDATCSSGNIINSPDTIDNVGGGPSLQLDLNGYPVISYYDYTNSNLKIIHCGDEDCLIISSVQSPDTIGVVGSYTSLQLDSDGFPVISYYDNTNSALKVLHCGDEDCSIISSVQSPDTVGLVGWYTSLQLDSNGFPVVSYYDATNGDLKILHCGDEDCSSGNTIESPDTTGDVGLYTSLQLDSNDNPVISYMDATNGDLKILYCDDPNCSGLTIEFDSATYSENENVAILNLTFEVSGEDTTTTGPNTVDIDITGGTASGLGVDYTYTDPTTLTILAGDYTTPQTITSTITIINDSDIENSETILLELTNADVDTTIGSQSTSTVTIIDDDSSSPVIATSNSSGGNVLRRLFLPKHTSLSSNSQQSFCPYFTNFLVRGNRDGEDNITDVSKLQTFLNERGYKAGYTDGSFGVNTEKALKSWQGAFANDVLSVWRAFLQPTGYFYQSSRHVANKQVGCTNITTVLDNGVVLQ